MLSLILQIFSLIREDPQLHHIFFEYILVDAPQQDVPIGPSE
jgi:hypothetical protein